MDEWLIVRASMHMFITMFQGFETRGTTISERITAWKNIEESVRPSGSLTSNPSELSLIASIESNPDNITEEVSSTPLSHESSHTPSQRKVSNSRQLNLCLFKMFLNFLSHLSGSKTEKEETKS